MLQRYRSRAAEARTRSTAGEAFRRVTMCDRMTGHPQQDSGAAGISSLNESLLADPLVRIRVALTAVLLCYVAAIVITGFVPLSPSLEIPLALGGWLCFAGLLVWGKTR